MPIHEGEAFLDATLASLPNCTDGTLEVIALDSSPHQRCRAIFDRHAGRWPLHYEHRPDTMSWTAKTNMAVAMAKAEHVAMLHQDDLWLPGRLDHVMGALGKEPQAAMIVSAATIVDGAGRTLGRWRCPLGGQTSWDGHAVMERLLVQNFIALPSAVLRRDLWQQTGGLDETLWYTPDWDLYLKIAALGRVHYIADPTVAFRVHGGSLTVTGSRDEEDFLAQMETVATRYMPQIQAGRMASVRRRARASARINMLLARAMHGHNAALLGALGELLRLPPLEIITYFRDSRIVERVMPRLQAHLRGAL